MANALYRPWKGAFSSQTSNAMLLTNTIRFTLYDSSIHSFSATHSFVSNIGFHRNVSQALANKSFFTNGANGGAFKSDDVLMSVSDATYLGFVGNVLVMFVDSGSDSSSRVIGWWDTGVTGLPYTVTSGKSARIACPTNGWFAL